MDSKDPSLYLENKERIEFKIKKYPNVVGVGVGLKEISEEITQDLCYRVYVSEKKDPVSLNDHERIPSIIDGFRTDVIFYGVIEEIADTTHYRPLKGGIQIKNDSYVDEDKRGVGTLGCLALSTDSETAGQIVGLTCDHVVFLNTQISEQPFLASGKIGQPQKVICCCCFVKNIVGEVLSHKKNPRFDCAIFTLHSDIVKDIKAKGTLREIQDVGSIKGLALPIAGAMVKKRGAATGLTRGKIVDIAFDDHQILVASESPSGKFADFGDSGSIILDEDNLVIGLLWGTKRDRFKSDDPVVPDEDPRSTHNRTHALKPRVHGVATPIAAVEEALKIKIPVPPPQIPTISIHPNDTKTHAIRSILPPTKKPRQHFVTAKGDGDVLLKVTFDQPVENARIGWTSDSATIVYPAVTDDNSTARISRAVPTGSRSEVGVTIDGEPAGDKVVVWIVWSTGREVVLEDELKVEIEQDAVKATRVFRVSFQIQPPEIIPANADEDDVPDLRGANASPPPNVPDTDSDQVFNKGVDLSGGALLKWDASVSIRYNIVNTALINTGGIGGGFHRPFLEYPSLPIVGNYDTSAMPGEDPYVTDVVSGKKGEFGISVSIVHSFPHSANPLFPPLDNIPIEFRIHHRSFARIELDGHWYLISEDLLGRTHLLYLRKDEVMVNSDLNNDGDKADLVWLGTVDPNSPFALKLSFTDLSNNDFE